MDSQRAEDHPLYKPLMAAIHQAMFGKGERHGGAKVPWLEQPIFHYAKMHGRGFLTGQAAKKLEEAASTRNHEAFVTEVLGAIVYCGAALIREQQLAQERGEDAITFERKWPWLTVLMTPEGPVPFPERPDLHPWKGPERRAQPLCEGSIEATKEQATRGHDGPGGLTQPLGDKQRSLDAWAAGRDALVGRYGTGRFATLGKVPAPAREMDARVFANRDRNCDTCRHRPVELDEQPCAECQPRHGHPYWEPRQG